MLFLEAIAREEGFGIPGNRPTRNNNPGDLEFRGWEVIYGGAKGTDPRFTHFATILGGYKALQHLFTFPLYFGKSLEQAFSHYAPPAENATNLYLSNVCKWTGLTKDSIVTIDLLKIPDLVTR